MSVTPSNMPELGLPAPDFALPDTEGEIVSRDQFSESPANRCRLNSPRASAAVSSGSPITSQNRLIRLPSADLLSCTAG